MQTKKRGFTLLEMMIVIAIIGILTSLASIGTKKLGERKSLYEIHNGFSNFLQEKTSYFRRRRLNYEISLNNDKITLESITKFDSQTTSTKNGNSITANSSKPISFDYALPRTLGYKLIKEDGSEDTDKYQVLVGEKEEELDNMKITKETLVITKKKDKTDELLKVELKNVISGRILQYTFKKP